MKNIGTDEFVAKDLKTKERFSDKQKEEETQQDHSDELGNVHVHEFDIVFNAEMLKWALQSRFNGRFVSMRRLVALKQINTIARGRNNREEKLIHLSRCD